MLNVVNRSGGNADKIAELRVKRQRLAAERDALADTIQDAATTVIRTSDTVLSPGNDERVKNLDKGIEATNAAIAALVEEERARLSDGLGDMTLERGDGTGPTTVARFSGSPWDAGERLDLRDRARYALDSITRDSAALPVDGGAERVTRALDGHDGADIDVLSRWTATVSDPAYLRAFTKLMRDPTNGHREFTGDELVAYQRTQTLARAMSLTDTAGGFMVPFQLDPSIILTSDGTINPIRRIARVVVATGDVWNGVSSAGVTASWKAEAAESTDDSPTLAQPAITVHKANAFVPISIEASMDAVNVAQEVGRLLVDGKETLESLAFIKGTGSGQPFGISGALTANLPAGSKVATAAADTLALGDVVKPQNALPPRFQARAQWVANLAVLNSIAAFETTGGALRFPELANGQLLRKPISEASNMDAPGATAAAGNDAVLLYGDWSHYVIADRIGTTIEFIPHLFHTGNNRPSGTRGWYMFARVGADTTTDAAFRLLTA